MSSLLFLLPSLAAGFTLQPTLPSGPRGLTPGQHHGSVAAPLPSLGATDQYKGATQRVGTEQVGPGLDIGLD